MIPTEIHDAFPQGSIYKSHFDWRRKHGVDSTNTDDLETVVDPHSFSRIHLATHGYYNSVSSFVGNWRRGVDILYFVDKVVEHGF